MQQVDRVRWAEPAGLGVWVRVGLGVVAVEAVWTNLGCWGVGGRCGDVRLSAPYTRCGRASLYTECHAGASR